MMGLLTQSTRWKQSEGSIARKGNGVFLSRRRLRAVSCGEMEIPQSMKNMRLLWSEVFENVSLRQPIIIDSIPLLPSVQLLGYAAS